MKAYHFVYKTTCKTTHRYYIGVHSTNNLDDGYLGSGIRFLKCLKKYGSNNFSREILKFCSSRDEAFDLEKSILTEDVLNDKACLNIIDGGRGNAHKYGGTFKERISKTRKLKILQGEIVPTKHTEEHKRRMRENNPGGKATAKAIHQIDTSGHVIKTWPSSRSAGVDLGFKNWRNLSASANKRTTQTAYGFYWRWVGDSDVVSDYLTTIDELERVRTDRACRAGRQILQLSMTGDLISVWKNMCEVAKHLHLDNSSISLAIKKRKPCAGYYWTKQ